MMTRALSGRLRKLEPRHQQARHALLLAQQRAPRRLGRMRREDRLDAQLPEQRERLLERETVLLQPVEAVLQPARLRTRIRVHVLAPAPDAMNLLRHVHDLEPRRERTDQLERLFRWPSLRAHDQRHAVIGIALAAPDRGLPIAFDRIEERLAALLLQHLADEMTERMHVVAQRRVLRWEMDALAWHECRMLQKSLS